MSARQTTTVLNAPHALRFKGESAVDRGAAARDCPVPANASVFIRLQVPCAKSSAPPASARCGPSACSARHNRIRATVMAGVPSPPPAHVMLALPEPRATSVALETRPATFARDTVRALRMGRAHAIQATPRATSRDRRARRVCHRTRRLTAYFGALPTTRMKHAAGRERASKASARARSVLVGLRASSRVHFAIHAPRRPAEFHNMGPRASFNVSALEEHVVLAASGMDRANARQGSWDPHARWNAQERRRLLAAVAARVWHHSESVRVSREPRWQPATPRAPGRFQRQMGVRFFAPDTAFATTAGSAPATVAVNLPGHLPTALSVPIAFQA